MREIDNFQVEMIDKNDLNDPRKEQVFDELKFVKKTFFDIIKRYHSLMRKYCNF